MERRENGGEDGERGRKDGKLGERQGEDRRLEKIRGRKGRGG